MYSMDKQEEGYKTTKKLKKQQQKNPKIHQKTEQIRNCEAAEITKKKENVKHGNKSAIQWG